MCICVYAVCLQVLYATLAFESLPQPPISAMSEWCIDSCFRVRALAFCLPSSTTVASHLLRLRYAVHMSVLHCIVGCRLYVWPPNLSLEAPRDVQNGACHHIDRFRVCALAPPSLLAYARFALFLSVMYIMRYFKQSK